MKPVPINEAEAIVVPLFDSGLVNHQAFAFEEEGDSDGSFKPSWDCSILHTRAKRFRLRWHQRVEMEGYDRVRLFINYPPHVHMSMTARVGGVKRDLIRDLPGQRVPFEPTSESIVSPGLPQEVEEMEWSFVSSRAGETLISFYWIGAVNSLREPLIEERLPAYAASWEGLIDPAGRNGITVPLFGRARQLAELRDRGRSPCLRPLMEKLATAAAEWESYSPEPHIRQFIPCTEHLYRYVRVRDRDRPSWEDRIQILSLAGYLCGREDWSRLAARLLLSIVHTPRWFEGPQGCFPGSAWHHVCFMEAHYSSALCFALQFMGSILTPRARELALDRIEEAWRLINAKCEEPGYRWYMNQGVVFNSDRLLAAMALHRHGRGEVYAGAVEQAYRDHATVLDNYLAEDGHCSEGGGYYAYSFGTSLRLWLAYAEFTGKPVAEVVPARFMKSLAFVEASTSSVNELGYIIPHGAAGFRPWPSSLVAFLAAHCGWDCGWSLLRHRMEQGQDSDPVQGMDALVLLLSVPGEMPAGAPRPAGVRGCPRSGLVAYDFPEPHRGKLLLQCERPASGHHHQDRGNIVLEAGGEVLLPDLGTLNYARLQAAFMKYSDWHNLAAPVGLPMRLQETRQPADPRAVLEQAEEQGGRFLFTMNLAPIYGDEVKIGRREGELTLTAAGGRLVLRDSWAFAKPTELRLTFQSLAPWTVAEGVATSVIGTMNLGIQFHEAGGAPLQVSCVDDRVDNLDRRIHGLSILAPSATATKLVSVVCFSKEHHGKFV